MVTHELSPLHQWFASGPAIVHVVPENVRRSAEKPLSVDISFNMFASWERLRQGSGCWW